MSKPCVPQTIFSLFPHITLTDTHRALHHMQKFRGHQNGLPSARECSRMSRRQLVPLRDLPSAPIAEGEDSEDLHKSHKAPSSIEARLERPEHGYHRPASHHGLINTLPLSSSTLAYTAPKFHCLPLWVPYGQSWVPKDTLSTWWFNQQRGISGLLI